MTDKIAWIDVETTGLSENATILEVAAVTTDLKGDILGPRYHYMRDIYHETAGPLIRQMEPVVFEMHTKSGLIMDLLRNCHEDFEGSVKLKELTEWVQDFAEGAYLGGASVHMDRMWLKKWIWPLSHRHVDITTLSIAGRAAGIPDQKVKFDDLNSHRAMDDVLWSIRVYKQYIKIFGGDTYQ